MNFYTCNIMELHLLPKEILLHIINYLPTELITLSQVSKYYNTITKKKCIALLQDCDIIVNLNNVFLVYQCIQRYDYAQILLKKNHIYNAFYKACKNNDISIMLLILLYSNIEPHANNSAAMIIAAENGNIEIIKLLTQHTDVGTDTIVTYMLSSTISPCKYNKTNKQEYIVLLNKVINEYCVKIQHIDPGANYNTAIAMAAKNGHMEIVKLLMQDPRVNAEDNNNYAIQIAAKNLHFNVMTQLLTGAGVSLIANDNVIIRTAIQDGEARLLEFLLQYPDINPSLDNNIFIQNASQCGYAEIVRLLLTDWYVDPSTNDNYAICIASQLGHYDVVKILLSDDRVDPGANKNQSILNSIVYGHLDIFTMLLGQELVIIDAEVLYTAVVFNRIEFVNMLLKNPLIDPTINNNAIIKNALRKGSVSVIKLLIQHNSVQTNPVYKKELMNIATRYCRQEIISMLIDN